MCKFPPNPPVPAATPVAASVTPVASKKLSTKIPTQRVVDDHNILQALKEDWDPETTTSPGLEEHLQYRFEKSQGSSMMDCVRQPRNLWERFAFTFIRDSRDLKVFFVCSRATVTLIPSTIFMYLYPTTFPWYWGIIHTIMVLTQIAGYTLALHVTAHRPTWKFSVLDKWLPVVLGPFFGQTWYTYYFHHIKMHHVSDNGPEDISSTVFFQRDSFIGFLYYFGRFFFFGVFDLTSYFFTHNQPKRSAIAGSLELTSIGLVVFLATKVAYWPTFFAFILPFILSRYGMMSGNWVQHAFLDPQDPLGGGLHNSITIISTPFNWCFNDGYHASHHLHPKRHWTEHPREFLTKKQEYYDSKAMVLQKLDYEIMFFYLMFKRYDLIAKNWIHLGPEEEKMSEEEVVEFLKRKTKRFTKADIERLYKRDGRGGYKLRA
ncbi:hypothetical protein HDV05_003114 [Chytridiales sp. JEL 0842]|nr:hypothetical protein HDV05_003114 [Chytridiales sp. JEL 0842]